MPRFLSQRPARLPAVDPMGGFANRWSQTATGGGSFTVPQDVFLVWITVTGGGGGGSGNAGSAGGGGAASTVWRRALAVTPGASLTISVGTGGAGGGTNGSAGNDTTATDGTTTYTGKGGSGAQSGSGGAGGSSGSSLEPWLAGGTRLLDASVVAATEKWHGLEVRGEAGQNGATSGGGGRSWWSTQAAAPTQSGSEYPSGYGSGGNGVAGATGGAGRQGVCHIEW